MPAGRSSRRRACCDVALGMLAALLPALAHADPPLSYLSGSGAKAAPVVSLTWGILGISIFVTVVIGALILVGVLRNRVPGMGEQMEAVPVRRGGNGLRWLSIGVGLSFLALLGTVVWTVMVLAAVSSPPGGTAMAIEVTGNQWWWKVRYLNDDPSQIFTTANEIHIPVGKPVQVKLITTDVIHSFWVPALSGKTDTIPGQINVTWLQADRPGVYRGQCTEFCGAQHAHMGFLVIAEPQAEFEAWRAAQLKPAAPAVLPEVKQGEQLFVYRCGACHMVRGTLAGGRTGPDLTHLMSRRTIAAVTLPLTIANLSAWIADPQANKPGTRMPNMYVSGPELQSLRTYLETLN